MRKKAVSIEALAIDLFHTLVDVGQVPERVGRFTADILGVERARWNAACFGRLHEICERSDAYEIVRRLAHSLNPDIPEACIREAVVARQQRFDYALRNVDKDVLDALRGLRERGLRLVLVSNASTAEVSAWHASPLAGLFDAVVFSCEVGSRKPQPDIYTEALRRIGVSAPACLFVGDGGSDEHRGARAVGMSPVLITRYIVGRLDEASLMARRNCVDWVIEDLAQLHAVLDARRRETVE